MSSFIHFKFKSAKDFDTYRFEGAGIPVWELKQEIIQIKKLGKGMDFDLVIINAQTGEEYRSDSFIIPKTTSVLVKRVPGLKVRQYGSGNAQMVDRRAEMMQPVQPATTSSFAEYFPTRPNFPGLPRTPAPNEQEGAFVGSPSLDEDAKIAAMMSASSDAWSQNQQHIGIGQESFRPRAYKPQFRPPLQPSAPPPPNYVCFRCGQKGHYITHCPTNADPNFDKPKLKKSTGIPRAFLQTVQNTGDSSGGLLVTPDGSLVVAVSNDQEWQKISAAASRTLIKPESIPETLKCKICKNLLNEPSSCPSCKNAFCEECILKTGPPKALNCPSCHASFMVEQLIPSDALKKEIDQFLIASQQNQPAAPTTTILPLPPNIPAFPGIPLPPFPGFPFMRPPFPFPPPPPFIPPPPPVVAPPVNAGRDRSKSPPAHKRSRSRSRSRSESPGRSPKRTSRRV